MPSETVLTLQDVTIRYGPTVAVDGLCLEVSSGEIFGLLGPNGSGKSSTLAAISGGMRPSTGRICVRGVEERRQPLGYRRLIGLVPQEPAFYEELSARDNLRFFGRLYNLRGRDLQARITEALAFVCLTEDADRPARTYSGGMQRRLSLACALLHRPALLLLDEPTVGLDIQSRDAIFASLRSLREQGCAMVFTTHHMEEAELLCDRLGIMNCGKLIALGTLPELTDVAHPRRLRFDSPHRGRSSTPVRLECIYLELTARNRVA